MGAWGIGLYSGDFAMDLKTAISAVCRLPLDEEALVDAICGSQSSAAADPANEDHTIFWLVVADQFEKRVIFSKRVQQTALAVSTAVVPIAFAGVVKAGSWGLAFAVAAVGPIVGLIVLRRVPEIRPASRPSDARSRETSAIPPAAR